MLGKKANKERGRTIGRLFIFTGIYLFFLGCQSVSEKGELLYIDHVPTEFPVNFALFTTDSKQYVAYYDSSHIMTIAARELNSEQWEYQILDSKIGFDSHNYISLMVDSLGYIHIVGNMHSSPLVYFKSSEPENIQSFQAINKMIGSEENVTTYPEFLMNKQGEIIFHYRYGRSGDGYEVFNALDITKQQWKRLLTTPLIDGEGLMNAYLQGPVLGPDDYYHIIWVWRDTWDCSTNHTLSYARSHDLIEWESIRGEKVELPIRFGDEELYVDTTASGGGLLNIGIEIGFAANDQALIAYHKYDNFGNTQIFVARFDNDLWRSRRITDWDYRWDFKGMGTIKNELLLDAPFVDRNTQVLIVGFHHIKYGDGQILLNNEELIPLSIRLFETDYPAFVDSVKSDFPGMLVNKLIDKGNYRGDKKYMLRWETLPPNRDDSLEGEKPKPGRLELIEY